MREIGIKHNTMISETFKRQIFLKRTNTIQNYNRPLSSASRNQAERKESASKAQLKRESNKNEPRTYLKTSKIQTNYMLYVKQDNQSIRINFKHAPLLLITTKNENYNMKKMCKNFCILNLNEKI